MSVRYCNVCGRETVKHTRRVVYNEYTGKPIPQVFTMCPTRVEDRFNDHYSNEYDEPFTPADIIFWVVSIVVISTLLIIAVLQ